MPGLRLLTGFATAALLIALGAQAAGVQTAPSVPQGPSGPGADCKQSNLTAPVFLNMLNAIIKYGDLTDIVFLQKSLGTKFNKSYGPGPDGKPDYQEPEYDSDQVFGAPIHVQVVIHLDVIEGKPSVFRDEIARMKFESVGTFAEVGWGYIHDCMKLMPSNLGARRYGAYAATPFDVVPTSNISEAAARPIPGRNDTKLGIGWTYETVTTPVTAIDLWQYK